MMFWERSENICSRENSGNMTFPLGFDCDFYIFLRFSWIHIIFQILCQREHSCRAASYTIALTSAPRPVAVESMNIMCNEVNSCMGASFAIYNGQIDSSTIPLRVIGVKVKIECIGQNACTGTNINVDEHVEVDLVCGDLRFCEMCFNNGVPCHPDAMGNANANQQQAIMPGFV